MPNSQSRANLLLPRVPWKRHQQEQGESCPRKRQVGRKAEGPQEEIETQDRCKVRRTYAVQTWKTLLLQLPLEPEEFGWFYRELSHQAMCEDRKQTRRERR